MVSQLAESECDQFSHKSEDHIIDKPGGSEGEITVKREYMVRVERSDADPQVSANGDQHQSRAWKLTPGAKGSGKAHIQV